MRGLLDPKVDFVFKNIFGSPKHPRVLISFLNAILKPKNRITSVEIKGRDIIEIHFIEVPKLPKDSDEKDMLTAWTEFLRDPESEKVRSLEMSVEEIREAKDELVRLSNDKEQREIYEMRAKILRDKVSALHEAERKGIEKGKRTTSIENATNFLKLGLDVEVVAQGTGLSIEEVNRIKSAIGI